MGRTYGEKVVHEAPVAPTLAKMLKCQYRCQGIWWKVFKLVVILLLTLSNRTVFVCFSGFIYVNYLLTFFLANFLKPIYLQVLWSLWLLYISFSITIQLSTEKLHRLYFLFVKFYFKDASKSDKTLAVRSSSEQPNYPSCTHRSIPVDFIFTGNMKGISCIQVQLRSFAIKLISLKLNIFTLKFCFCEHRQRLELYAINMNPALEGKVFYMCQILVYRLLRIQSILALETFEKQRSNNVILAGFLTFWCKWG